MSIIRSDRSGIEPPPHNQQTDLSLPSCLERTIRYGTESVLVQGILHFVPHTGNNRLLLKKLNFYRCAEYTAFPIDCSNNGYYWGRGLFLRLSRSGQSGHLRFLIEVL